MNDDLRYGENGIRAQEIGQITKEQGIRIKNKGAFCPDKNPPNGLVERGLEYLVF